MNGQLAHLDFVEFIEDVDLLRCAISESVEFLAAFGGSLCIFDFGLLLTAGQQQRWIVLLTAVDRMHSSSKPSKFIGYMAPSDLILGILTATHCCFEGSALRHEFEQLQQFVRGHVAPMPFDYPAVMKLRKVTCDLSWKLSPNPLCFQHFSSRLCCAP